jgi:hypothetical protein
VIIETIGSRNFVNRFNNHDCIENQATKSNASCRKCVAVVGNIFNKPKLRTSNNNETKQRLTCCLQCFLRAPMAYEHPDPEKLFLLETSESNLRVE